MAETATTMATAYATVRTSAIADGTWEWRVVALDISGGELGASPWRAFTVAGTLTASEPVQIQGSGAVGTLLTSQDPSWNQPGVANAYQWLREGQAITGASSPSYEVTVGDVGKKLSLRVTGTLAGYRAGTSTSAMITGVLNPAPTVAQPPTLTGSGDIGTALVA